MRNKWQFSEKKNEFEQSGSKEEHSNIRQVKTRSSWNKKNGLAFTKIIRLSEITCTEHSTCMPSVICWRHTSFFLPHWFFLSSTSSCFCCLFSVNFSILPLLNFKHRTIPDTELMIVQLNMNQYRQQFCFESYNVDKMGKRFRRIILEHFILIRVYQTESAYEFLTLHVRKFLLNFFLDWITKITYSTKQSITLSFFFQIIAIFTIFFFYQSIILDHYIQIL